MILSVPITSPPGGMSEWLRKAATAINQLIAKRLNVVEKAAAYTITEGDDVVLGDATAAAFTVTLPPVAKYKGRTFVIKKIDGSANAITVDGTASETIEGAATASLASQYDGVTVLAGPTEWLTL